MNSNEQQKMVIIKDILDQPVYLPESRIYVNVQNALMKMSLDNLECLFVLLKQKPYSWLATQ